MTVAAYIRGHSALATTHGRASTGDLSPAEWVELWQFEIERAYVNARRRGVVHPSLSPEVLRAKSFLRYWRAVRELRNG